MQLLSTTFFRSTWMVPSIYIFVSLMPWHNSKGNWGTVAQMAVDYNLKALNEWMNEFITHDIVSD